MTYSRLTSDLGGGFDARPPPGEEIRVKFRLEPKEEVEYRGGLYLEATLYRDGSRQDATKSSIEHAYASGPDGFF